MTQIALGMAARRQVIGDAMLIFFGDPETRGVPEDARACIRWPSRCSGVWRRSTLVARPGVEEPFPARIGVNSGSCNVGNFGSDERMDYTIIGAEANLAARLQADRAPGRDHAQLRDLRAGQRHRPGDPQDPIRMKGISRDVVPYAIEGDLGARPRSIFSEHARGIDFYIDVDALEADGAARIRRRLLDTLAAVERRMKGASPRMRNWRRFRVRCTDGDRGFARPAGSRQRPASS